MTDRVPYAEREQVIREHCTCDWVFQLDRTEGWHRSHMHSRDPDCKLHGDNASPAPF